MTKDDDDNVNEKDNINNATVDLPMVETANRKSSLLSAEKNDEENEDKEKDDCAIARIELLVAQKKVLKPGKWTLSKRHLFTGFAFTGMLALYALRFNLSVVIVSMVKRETSGNNTDISSKEAGEFEWDEKVQSHVLSAFFFGYVVSQLPGGRLADSKLGAKWLLGIGILLTAVFTMLSPMAARVHYGLFIGCRVVEGLFEGVVIPSMHSMIAKWCPPTERSTTAGIIYSGSHFGTVLTMPIAALISDSPSLGGWPAVFYVFGGVAFIWSLGWLYFISETPSEHPTISQEELRLILMAQRSGSSSTGEKQDIPWRSIFTSGSLWALTATHFGQNWGFYTLLTQMPRYFKELGFDLTSNGFFSALPYLSQALVGIGAGFLCDRLLKKHNCSLTVLRKSFNCIAFFGAGSCLLLVTLVGRSQLLNILLLIGALGLDGFCTVGFYVTHIDMSPAYAASLMGITNCVANFAGIFAPLVVGQILARALGENEELKDNQDSSERILQAWHSVFHLSAAVFFTAAIVFVLFGSNSVQSWNDPAKSEKAKKKKAKNVL